MTQTHYQAPDQIVTVLVTTDDNRHPRHDLPMVVFKLRPQQHSRCRAQWGGITYMPTHNEIRSLLEAIQQCEPGFTFDFPSKFKNKPEWRKRAWQQRNGHRVAQTTARRK